MPAERPLVASNPPAPPRRSRWRLALIGAGSILLAWLLVGFDWPGIGRCLAAANLRMAWPILAALVGFLALRSLRFWLLLRATEPALPFLPVHAANALGIGLGNFSPMQVGEVVKVELIARGTDTRRLDLATAFVVERALDLLLLIVMLALGLGTAIHGWSPFHTASLWWLLAGLVPGILLLGMASRLWPSAAAQVVAQLRRLGARPATLSIAFLLTVASWALVIVWWIDFAAMLNIDLGALQAMTLVAGVALLRVLTLVPGGIGVDEAGIVGLMLLMGFAAAPAQAYALAGRLIDVAFVLLALPSLPALRTRARAGHVAPVSR